MGKFCKCSAVILFLLVIILSCFLSGEFGEHGFSWKIFSIILISGACFCTLMFAIGEIIDQLAMLNSNSTLYEYKIYKILSEISSEKGWKINLSKDKTLNLDVANDEIWICDNCKSKNEDGKAQFCKICGKYR